jgi:hypothetical protein
MALFPSAIIQGHRVDVCLSLIDLLSMASQYLLVILILSITLAMHVRERTMMQNIKNGNNSPNDMWSIESRVDLGSKDRVLYDIL